MLSKLDLFVTSYSSSNAEIKQKYTIMKNTEIKQKYTIMKNGFDF